MRNLASRLGGALLAAAALPATAQETVDPKVLVVTMFESETAPWRENLDLPRRVPVAGLPQDYPALHCNADVCVMTTAMGFANAASSLAAVVFSDAVDLSDAYVLIAGIAGVNPQRGTLGSAHWAEYVVDGGLRHQIDPRETPEGWATGSFALGASAPGEAPGWRTGTEVYHLDPALVDAAYRISKDVALADSDKAASYRARYDAQAAQRQPFVSRCDTISADTYWHGEMIAAQMAERMALLTDGDGTYCTTQQEDNASLTALARGAEAGRLHFSRVAVLRTASNFDRQAPEQSAAESLAAESGGFGPATENAYRVGHALVARIVGNWDAWSDGVPH